MNKDKRNKRAKLKAKKNTIYRNTKQIKDIEPKYIEKTTSDGKSILVDNPWYNNG